MADQVVHKLINPNPHQGTLQDLLLCWSSAGSPSDVRPDRIRFSGSINDTTCPECWQLWREGIYR